MSSNSSGKRLEGFLTGKGFYIVLFLCAADIGVSAWAMAAGNEAMEDLTQANNAVLDNRRVETVIIAPEATAKVETAAVEEEAMESVVEIEPPVEVQPVWNEAETVTVWPVQGELERLHDVQTLHYDVTLRDWRTHAGIDILAPLGETVRAAMSGTVQSVVEDGLYGTVVTIDHGDGTQAVYANLAALPAVATGDYVSAGDVIGAVGDTALCEIGQGTHLHFAMMLDGASVNPLDYLPA